MDSYSRRFKRPVSLLIDTTRFGNGMSFEWASEIGHLEHLYVDARCDAPCELPLQLGADHVPRDSCRVCDMILRRDVNEEMGAVSQ